MHLVFADNVTEEEYAALVEAARFTECPNCSTSYLRAAGISGPLSSRGNRYCSLKCAEIASRSAAPLRKPQPIGVKIDGWDV